MHHDAEMRRVDSDNDGTNDESSSGVIISITAEWTEQRCHADDDANDKLSSSMIIRIAAEQSKYR